MPIENSIKYKFLLKRSTGEVLWQPGSDRSFQAWESDNVITVTEEWDNAEVQKISEQKQLTEENAEVECKSSTDNPKEEYITSVSSHAGDLGSDENDSAENKNGANLKENQSSSAVKKSRISDRKTQKNDMPLRNRNVDHQR
ncbi:Cyclomaltodextrin glucanotransferase [Bienertia sinuspersici]